MLLFYSSLLSQSVNIPIATQPSIDGIISISEWNDSKVLPLTGGDSVYIKTNGRYFVRCSKGGEWRFLLAISR
jgi:hypothetical protein